MSMRIQHELKTGMGVSLFISAFPRTIDLILVSAVVGLGGLGVTCSPRDPRFAGSNPAEVDGFFRT